MISKSLASILAVASLVVLSPVFALDTMQTPSNAPVIQKTDVKTDANLRSDQIRSNDANFNRDLNVKTTENIQTPKPSTVNVNVDENDGDHVVDPNANVNVQDKTNVRINDRANFRDDRSMQRDFRAVPQPNSFDNGMNVQRDGRFINRVDQFRGGCGY